MKTYARLNGLARALTLVSTLWLARIACAATDVATIPGNFDVTFGGSATYTIPLKLPPGSGGVQPRLALSYDSQAGGGPLGAGWSIAGFSVISRGPKNMKLDGVVRGVVLDDSDALYLDGQRLIPLS